MTMLNYYEFLIQNIAERVKTHREAILVEDKSEKSKKKPKHRSKKENKKKSITASGEAAVLGLDPTMYLAIEAGECHEKKNPYFLAKRVIEVICQEENINFTPVSLVWGDVQEQMKFVKMLLLALLVGTGINPFLTEGSNPSIEEIEEQCNKKLSEWKPDLRVSTNSKYETIEKRYKTILDFFTNEKNAQNYSILIGEYENKNLKPKELTDEERDTYTRIRGILMRHLMEDFEFSKSFLPRYYRYMKNMDDLHFYNSAEFQECEKRHIDRMAERNTESNQEEYISQADTEEYIDEEYEIEREELYKKQRESRLYDIDAVCNELSLFEGVDFADLIIENVPHTRWDFMVAFDKMCRKYGEYYLEIFQKKLFRNEELITGGLQKMIKGDFIRILLLGEDFRELQDSLVNPVREETDYEAMLVRMNFELQYYLFRTEEILADRASSFENGKARQMHKAKDLEKMLIEMSKIV